MNNEESENIVFSAMYKVREMKKSVNKMGIAANRTFEIRGLREVRMTFCGSWAKIID